MPCRLVFYLSLLQGRSQRGGACPQLSIEWIFYRKKYGFVGTVLSTRSVLWTSNMPKCVGGQTPPLTQLGELTVLSQIP